MLTLYEMRLYQPNALITSMILQALDLVKFVIQIGAICFACIKKLSGRGGKSDYAFKKHSRISITFPQYAALGCIVRHMPKSQ